MSGIKRDTLLGTTAVVALLSAALPALAQDAASQQSGDSAPAPVLEEVVVTGARNNQYGTDVVQAGSFRGANALDVPLGRAPPTRR